jgi:hypothetical protein
MKKTTFNQEVIEHAISKLKCINPDSIYGCDLHNELFNSDYFIIGYYNANEFINEMGGAWESIHKIKNYEKDVFGEVYTDLSNCEKVANMLAYIEGELILLECTHLESCWDLKLTEKDIKIITTQLNNL